MLERELADKLRCACTSTGKWARIGGKKGLCYPVYKIEGKILSKHAYNSCLLPAF